MSAQEVNGVQQGLETTQATPLTASIKPSPPPADAAASENQQLNPQSRPPPPLRDPSHHAEKSLEAYQFFIVTMITISIFGASTFTVIAGEMTDPATIWAPDPPPFTLPSVRRFLAAAWLCFSLVIAIAGYSSSVMVIMRHRAERQLDTTWHKRWEPLGLLTSAVLHILIVTAFLLLSLSLVAYVGAFGWFIVACACAALVFAVGLVIVQYQDSKRSQVD